MFKGSVFPNQRASYVNPSPIILIELTDIFTLESRQLGSIVEIVDHARNYISSNVPDSPERHLAV